MAEPLKNYFGAEIPRKIAAMISHVHSDFPAGLFLDDALDGYESLELMPRGRQIAVALAKHLPQDYPKAVRILMDSMGPKLDQKEQFGMGPFLYMPYAFFIASQGLNHWDESMRAQYELTQRFTAEFSIRPFIIHHQEKTLHRLHEWVRDPSPHVRRLVSEGTRPRLPWAMRLPAFQKDPRPILSLLEKLKDDAELYVRRSVANNLNDIGKDNPKILFEIARQWMKKAPSGRVWLIHHALRSSIKAGAKEALNIMGFKTRIPFQIKKATIEKFRDGNKNGVCILFELRNPSGKVHNYLVDFQIHYRKSNGKTSPKVFKLSELTLQPQEARKFQKRISLENMTTRKHYAGVHKVDVLVNGTSKPLGQFRI